uniref:Beta-1,4-glucuronyltransferase 1-like n=1 Tax=Strongyloides papillosus TaxID=174720 RepID=A0A0N5BAI8_STREA
MIKYLLTIFFIFLMQLSDGRFSITYYSSYIYIKNIIKGQHKFGKDRITLVLNSQSSNINKNILNQIDNWKGPISLGIFFDVDDIFNFKTLCKFCVLNSIPNISNKTSVHFIFPYSALSKDNKDKILLNEYFNDVNCEENTKVSNNICDISTENEDEDTKINRIIRYPINVIRNIARKEIKTKFMTFADINDYFSQDFEYKMSKLISEIFKKSRKTKKKMKNILVYQSFDVDSSVEKLKTKKELLQLVNSSKAFLSDTFLNNTEQINLLEEWFYKKETQTPSVQFITTYRHSNWDPQFISDNKIPYFDERFPYPLKDRVQLKWHLCRQQYKFLVVNDVFMYHYGIQNTNERKLVRKAKYKVLRKTIRVIKEFNKKMWRSHPKTVKTCPRVQL